MRDETGWDAARSEVLRRHGVSEATLLAAGEEADVFALGDCVLRIYRAAADPAAVAGRSAFLSDLNRAGASFATPEVLDEGRLDAVLFTLERRIPGVSFDHALATLDAPVRGRALIAYVETALTIRRLGGPRGYAGEILSDDPVRRPTWRGFVVARAERALRLHGDRLAEVANPRRALDRLDAMLAARPEPRLALVHGDYHLGNVMAGPDGAITGVIDFGGLSLIGDPELDLAAAVLNLAGVEGITAEDRRVVSTHAASLGLTAETLELYGLWYAFRLLDTPREGLVRWCVGRIRAAAG
jgi:Ser/Thr protein kinase RdoA (MazF antagonist)